MTTSELWMSLVPKKFWHGPTKAPEAATVGDLMAVLSELPKEMTVTLNHGGSVQVIVTNIHADCRRVRLVEID